MWIVAELPPEIPAVCVVHAAEHFAVAPELLVSIAKVEGGKVGKRYERSHGTYFGPYQISDKWLPHLARWGYTADVLQHDACANVAAGAYVLAYYQHREQDWIRAIGRYNVGSLNTPARVEAAQRYITKVVDQWTRIYTMHAPSGQSWAQGLAKTTGSRADAAQKPAYSRPPHHFAAQ